MVFVFISTFNICFVFHDLWFRGICWKSVVIYLKVTLYFTWWRDQMETFSELLAFCAGNSPVTDEFPTQRPVTGSFGVFFDSCLNKRLSKQLRGWWFETLSRAHYDVIVMEYMDAWYCCWTILVVILCRSCLKIQINLIRKLHIYSTRKVHVSFFFINSGSKVINSFHSHFFTCYFPMLSNQWFILGYGMRQS